jgi:hypothetical protein
MTAIDYAEYTSRRDRLGLGKSAFVTHHQYQQDRIRIVELEMRLENVTRRYAGQIAALKQQVDELRDSPQTQAVADPKPEPEQPSALAVAAQEAVREEAQELPSGLASCADIKDAVCAFFSVSRLDLLSLRKTKNLMQARKIAVWLTCKHTPLSLPAIGRHFGGRHHTTIMHARDKANELLQGQDESAREQVKLISEGLGLPF